MPSLAISLLALLFAHGQLGSTVSVELEVAYPMFNPGNGLWATYRLEKAGAVGAVDDEILIEADCSASPCVLRPTVADAPKPLAWVKARIKDPGSASSSAQLVVSPFPLRHLSDSKLEPLRFEAGRIKILEAVYVPTSSGELQLQSWKLVRIQKGSPLTWK